MKSESGPRSQDESLGSIVIPQEDTFGRLAAECIIQKLNLAYQQRRRTDFEAMSDHARREQRLREIMEELKSMTDWKRI